MPYATQRDRTPGQLEIERAPWPAPPLNVFATSGYVPGVFDLQWDDPAQIPVNGRFRILGVNIYRSFDSEFGPFVRVTDLPVGATFWRDQTDNVLVEEDVSDRFILNGIATASGQDAPRYVFRTLHTPIVKEGSQQVPADYPLDVRVFIDGAEARVMRVIGRQGEVEIDPRMYPEVGTQTLTPAVIPGPGSKVTCFYRYTRALVKTDLAQRIFWRVATVSIPLNLDLATVQPQDLVETPLESAVATTSYEVEKLDYIWREAVRRNRWILDQGGERVKVFLRKNVGPPCPCDPSDQHKQPQNDCLECFGTGILGGYEGPYDLIMAPDDAERKISQTELGRTVEHTYETWTGPTPILAHRDFVVKVNGERYAIGGVRFPNNRGNIIQQHFTVGHLDEKDIRYKVPMGSPLHAPAMQFVLDGPENEANSDPTNKQNIPSEQQLRGRTIAWENIVYAVPLILLPLADALHRFV